jgi:hypothetical protein
MLLGDYSAFAEVSVGLAGVAPALSIRSARAR